MLVYTIPELAAEYRTSKDNIYALVSLGKIKTLQFTSQKIVSKSEAERFLIDNAGTSFEEMIINEKERRKLVKESQKIYEMKKESQA